MGGSLAREKDLGGDEVRTVRESSFILGGQAGGVYSTAYQEAIPETAKLTGSGNSQVLVLHLKKLIARFLKHSNRPRKPLQYQFIVQLLLKIYNQTWQAGLINSIGYR